MTERVVGSVEIEGSTRIAGVIHVDSRRTTVKPTMRAPSCPPLS